MIDRVLGFVWDSISRPLWSRSFWVSVEDCVERGLLGTSEASAGCLWRLGVVPTS